MHPVFMRYILPCHRRDRQLLHQRYIWFGTILLPLLLCCALLPQSLWAQAQPAAENAPDPLLQSLQAGGTEVTAISHSRATGKVNFLRLAPTVAAAGVDAQQATQAAQAAAFLNQYGALFGVTDATRQLQQAETTVDQWGGTHLRYTQDYAGIPVYGGELRVHFDGSGQLNTVNGTVVPDIDLDPTPTLSAQGAEAIALAVVQKTYATAALSLDLASSGQTLYIYRTGLAQGIPGRNHLAYEVTVHNGPRTIHELIYIDAHSGQLLDEISLVHTLDRQIYNGALDPAALVWAEGDPLPYSGPDEDDINRLIDYAEDTHNLFASLSGGTYRSFDGADATMHSVLIPDDPFFCPNAYWDGFSTNYCRGIDTDDIVAHEWTHAYTQFSHNLIYQWQPGGLNEAYSDIFGEVVDLLNSAGLDDPNGLRTADSCSLFSGADPGDASYRWLQGEESSVGAIRDMWNPNCYGDAGKVSDRAYWCSRNDNGGVHSISGIPNHAFALLVDGGTYNGRTIQPIGLTKAAHLYWHAATTYQTPVTQFSDHADALEASCSDLVQSGAELPGLSTDSLVPFGSGETMTAADCAAVSNVIAAVELRAEPVQCNFRPLLDATAPALCEEQGAIQTLALSDWEDGLGDWVAGQSDIGNPATFSYAGWQVIDELPAGREGQALFADNDPSFGNCVTDLESGVRYVESASITIPDDVVVPHVALTHLVATEYQWDGGNVKLSVNGGPWKLVQPAAFTFNGYNGNLIPPGVSDNPLAGETGFTGGNPNLIPWNWGQSQINLSGLVKPGDSIRLRLEMGTDGCAGLAGWFVDEVQVYACSEESAPAPRNPIFYVSSSSSGQVDGIRFNDEDILAYDTINGRWAMFFDGSDVGVGHLDLDALELLPDGDLLLSFNQPVTLDGLPVDDSDIVRFSPTSLGNTTAGTFTLEWRGAIAGLETHSEDVDAISFTPGGLLVVSTIGRVKTPRGIQLAARDEDLSVVNSAPYPGLGRPAPLPYFVGANVGLTKDSEDIGASWIDPLTGEIYLATRGTFRLKDNALQGDRDNIWVCDPAGLWTETACRPYTVWDGSNEFRNERIDGFAAGTLWPETADDAQAAAEETLEAEEDLADEDDIYEEGGTSEELNEPASRFYLPLIQR